MDDELATYAAETFKNRGVNVRVETKVVSRIERGKIYLSDGTTIASETIVLAAGVVANPLTAAAPKWSGINTAASWSSRPCDANCIPSSG